MLATKNHVKVCLAKKEVSDLPELQDELVQTYGRAEGLALSISSEFDVHVPQVFAASIVAGVACFHKHLVGKPISHSELQKKAFLLEKKLLKDQACALTTASIEGGLLFYRKEFEFYKTVVSVPAKLPQKFAEYLLTQSPVPEEVKGYSDARYIRRLIFSIMREDFDMFKKSLDLSRISLPSEDFRIEPSYKKF